MKDGRGSKADSVADHSRSAQPWVYLHTCGALGEGGFPGPAYPIRSHKLSYFYTTVLLVEVPALCSPSCYALGPNMPFTRCGGPARVMRSVVRKEWCVRACDRTARLVLFGTQDEAAYRSPG